MELSEQDKQRIEAKADDNRIIQMYHFYRDLAFLQSKEIAELKEALRRTIDFVEEDNDDAQYRHDLIEEIEQLLK
jgi:DNA polymerase sigma